MNFFKRKEKLVIPEEKPIIIVDVVDEWIEFEKEKPPHEVVLAACDTYDCGWIMHTVWWYEDKKRWMTTGGIKSKPAHLPYTHWRKLPSYPKD